MKVNYRINLNSILRLRLFYSTENELGKMVGLSLKKNHFSKVKPFVCEAFFSKFADLCKEYTHGDVDLLSLIYQYKNTSKFFQRYINETAHQTNKFFISYLLNHVYMGISPIDDAKCKKSVILSNQYDSANKNGGMNIGILILLTYGLIPTFDKGGQDVKDIVSDFKKSYEILSTIARSNKEHSSTKYKEMLCLKEMRDLIESEQQDDPYLNRLLLIYITNDILNRIYSFKVPSILRQTNQKVIPMDFELPTLWHCKDDAENIFWEFHQYKNCYIVFRKEIDYVSKKIRYTKYQLFFNNMGYKDFCYTIIMRPSHNWHNILKREQPDDSLSYDYTDIEYMDDQHTVKELRFTEDSPYSGKAITLEIVTKENELNYYRTYLQHEGDAEDYVDEDNQPEYSVALCPIEVAVSDKAIICKFDDGIYKLDKFDTHGNETISGIKDLNHNDNYVCAVLKDKDKERIFLCLDSINQNLDLEHLLNESYFNKIEQVSEIFKLEYTAAP